MVNFHQIFSTEKEDADEIERLRISEQPVLYFTLFLSFIGGIYVYINPELKPYFPPIMICFSLLNLWELFFQHYIVPSKHYGRTVSNLETIIISYFAIAGIMFTGGFNSPFFFTMYLIMMSTPISTVKASLILGIIQILLLSIATFISPSMLQVFQTDPIRAILMIFSPSLVTFFMIIMLGETEIQKKQKEKAQQLSEMLVLEKSKLETVMDSIGDIIIASDFDGTIILATERIGEISKYKRNEILGKSLSVIFPDLDLTTENKMQEISLERADSMKVDCQIMIKSLFDSKGMKVGTVTVFHNISEERELERMKLDFVSMAAHELRTPLTSIRGYLSVLNEENVQVNNEQKIYLQRMNIASDQLAVLVENLLNITKIEKGVLALNVQALDWFQTVKEVVDLLIERAQQKKITITLSKPDIPMALVLADKMRITEVVTNLLANAIAYTQPGGNVKISFEERENEILTNINDTGEGIPKEALPHLFTKFFRVSGKLEQGSKGTGLGLYIARAIVEMHQGRIWVDSEVGKGSTFSFSLPTSV